MMRNTETVRVRFAPSPTGHLHIGGLRTAFFNWLFARHNNGVFLLRIEDTDLERSKPEYVDSIVKSLNWVDIKADEPIIIQSQRLAEHKKVIDALLKKGKAYKCYCSEDDVKKRHPDKPFLKYDQHCRNIPEKNESYVVRFKLPDIQEIVFDDLIRGQVVFNRDQLDDFIIARSDGTPMYNFVVVVDDAHSKITHVIRGEDHISNTPKQILLYQACAYSVPQFAHIPLILGPSGDRLSKRDGAVSVLEYKNEGFLPYALLNYLVRLGWSHGDQEVFSRPELIEFFTLEAVGKKGSIFDQEKLKWMNGIYLRNMAINDLFSYIEKEMGIDINKKFSRWNKQQIEDAMLLYKDRVSTISELLREVSILYNGPEKYNAEEVKQWTNSFTADHLQRIMGELGQIQWTKDAISEAFKYVAKNEGVKLVTLAQPIRLALIGASNGPGVFDSMVVIGRASSIERIHVFKNHLKM